MYHKSKKNTQRSQYTWPKQIESTHNEHVFDVSSRRWYLFREMKQITLYTPTLQTRMIALKSWTHATATGVTKHCRIRNYSYCLESNWNFSLSKCFIDHTKFNKKNVNTLCIADAIRNISHYARWISTLPKVFLFCLKP